MSRFTPKVYETTRQKRLDFALGVGVWIVMNLIFAGIYIGLGTLSSQSAVSNNPILSTLVSISLAVMLFLPLVVNIALLIYFSVVRRWLALGMLSAFAGVFVLVLCASVVFLVWCFTGGLGNL